MVKKKNNNSDKEEFEPQEMQDQPAENEEESEHQESKGKKQSKKTKDEIIEELKIQQAKLNDKFIRLFSDFDNYRKRTNAEKLELIKTASRSVIEGLLPILDDFDRALTAFKEQGADEETIRGVELISTKLMTFLSQKGLQPMDSLGKDFDTDWHEAITQIPAPSEDMKGKVVDVVLKGYLLNGTIIRHAKVVVGQ